MLGDPLISTVDLREETYEPSPPPPTHTHTHTVRLSLTFISLFLYLLVCLRSHGYIDLYG